MNQRAIVAAAALALLSTAALAQPVAPKAGHEKCFGITKAGQNDCANISGTHSCAGQSKTDGNVAEWKYVPAGTCATLKGLTIDQAKAKVAADSKKG
ncbi:DUF2282 domain-containing protein [Caenimonas koreensis]|uniref:DUF2282 domain-containing protein n=1 Tax=Caenimonas koreensis DSM 17982 TaxID=1121255 RepID=A0A844BCH4_9BURK|nr:DUF2282 domain-containing protein [Caenimonas koreensis]MRD48201.1 DUF2282 domain-containing protein [Caenimonas koreensis DSM 17982]